MIGAIFARGSCRALKWMALFAVVLALGAGSAAAQDAPLAPTAVKVEGGERATEVILTWKKPTGSSQVDRYEYQSPVSSFSWTDADPSPMPVSGSNTETVTIQSLTALTEYKFRIRSVGPGGNSPWQTSDPPTFAPELAPAAPTMLTVASGNGTLTLGWTAAAVSGSFGDPDFYEYYAKAGAAAIAAADWKLVPGLAGASGIKITGLTNGTIYSVGVRAVNNGGGSTPLTSAAGTPSTVPGTPRGLIATPGTPAAGKVKVTLAWVAPADDGGSAVTSYEYQVVSDGKGWKDTGAHSYICRHRQPRCRHAVLVRGSGRQPQRCGTTCEYGSHHGRAGPRRLTFTPASQGDISVVAGTAITPMQLPTVTTGMGTPPYTYTATGLPAGWRLPLPPGCSAERRPRRQLRPPSPTPRRTAPA